MKEESLLLLSDLQKLINQVVLIDYTIIILGGEKMNCPYCGGALEKGTLHSRGGEYFLPDGAKLPAWFTRESMEKVGAVGLAWNPALTRREWPEAYCCRPCRRLIVPFPEEE